MQTAIRKSLTILEPDINRIDYPHGASTIPFIFTITDYAIPSGAVASFYVAKTGGSAKKKLSGAISGQTVTVTPDENMFSDPGRYCGTLILEIGKKSVGSYPIFIEATPNAGKEI